jgi:hypothetical protein
VESCFHGIDCQLLLVLSKSIDDIDVLSNGSNDLFRKSRSIEVSLEAHLQNRIGERDTEYRSSGTEEIGAARRKERERVSEEQLCANGATHTPVAAAIMLGSIEAIRATRLQGGRASDGSWYLGSRFYSRNGEYTSVSGTIPGHRQPKDPFGSRSSLPETHQQWSNKGRNTKASQHGLVSTKACHE